MINLDRLAGQPIQIFLLSRFWIQIFVQLFLAPWTTIAKPEEVVVDALGAFPTTQTISSSVLSRCISPRAWRLGGRLLLCIRESLWR